MTDRPTQCSEFEIEITPVMIEAGMNAYWREANPSIEDGDRRDRARILAAIFRSMVKASKSCVAMAE